MSIGFIDDILRGNWIAHQGENIVWAWGSEGVALGYDGLALQAGEERPRCKAMPRVFWFLPFRKSTQP